MNKIHEGRAVRCMERPDRQLLTTRIASDRLEQLHP